jgi:hypothetical protein
MLLEGAFGQLQQYVSSQPAHFIIYVNIPKQGVVFFVLLALGNNPEWCFSCK